MKAITFIKNNTIAMSIALATVIGFSAFNVIKKLDPPQDGWYEVTPDPLSPNDQSKQIIGERINGIPSGNCSTSPSSNPPCAVFLLLDDGTTEEPEGMSVEEATESTGYNAHIDVTEGDLGYAKKTNP